MKKIKRWIQPLKSLCITSGTFMLLLIYSVDSLAKNHLAGLKGDIVDTFGSGSDLPAYLLLAEGIFGVVAYIRSKNPMVLAGVPILMVFTHFALNIA